MSYRKLASALLFSCLSIIAVAETANTSSTSGPTASPSASTTKSSTNSGCHTALPANTQPSAISVTSRSLYKAYDDNSVAADLKYKGKLLKVTGKIENIDTDIMDELYVSLEGDGYFGTVTCYFSDQYKSAAAGLSKGSTITIEGTCDGHFIGPNLKNCRIEGAKTTSTTSGSSSAPSSITARKLYQEYDENAVAADLKFKGKTIKVTGTVENIDTDIMDDIYVSLEGDGYFGTVQCYISDSSINRAAALSKGSTVTIRGRCDGHFMGPILKNCTIE